MTTVRTVAAHEVVRATYPRPEVTERDELGMAVGKAIDHALSRYANDASRGLRPTAASTRRIAAEALDEELRDIDLRPPAAELDRIQAQIGAVIAAFRKSPLYGLRRPQSRLVLIGAEAGVYAQPDYWDGRSRFFEMKSYRAVPPPPDVRLQLSLFQLAFPGFEAHLVCLNRHAVPVEVLDERIPPLSEEEGRAVLDRARAVALDAGVEKVLEYVSNPIVRYA